MPSLQTRLLHRRRVLKLTGVLLVCILLIPVIISGWVDRSTVKGAGDFLIIVYLLVSIFAASVIAFDAWKRGMRATVPIWGFFFRASPFCTSFATVVSTALASRPASGPPRCVRLARSGR